MVKEVFFRSPELDDMGEGTVKLHAPTRNGVVKAFDSGKSKFKTELVITKAKAQADGVSETVTVSRTDGEPLRAALGGLDEIFEAADPENPPTSLVLTRAERTIDDFDTGASVTESGWTVASPDVIVNHEGDLKAFAFALGSFACHVQQNQPQQPQA